MPRSEALNQKLREESRERILVAALRVFAGHGYGGASMRMIAEEAGISPGLIYAYYSGKEALRDAIFERSMRDVRASFAAAASEHEPGRRLERLLRASFEIIKQNMDFWRLSYGIRMQAEALRGIEGALSEWTDEILRTLTKFLRNIGVREATLEARLLFAEIDGVAQHYVLDPKGYPLSRVVTRIIGRYSSVAGAR
ncbi:MAG: TetR/AcrR family transcriptional regulator [Gemmatimonadota bacterium]